MNPAIRAEPQYFRGRLIAVHVRVVRTVLNLQFPIDISQFQRTLARALINFVHEFNGWSAERIKTTVTGTNNLPRRSCYY